MGLWAYIHIKIGFSILGILTIFQDTRLAQGVVFRFFYGFSFLEGNVCIDCFGRQILSITCLHLSSKPA